ncbi:MAG TPA: GNAT family N-acetyltransferase [Symbiobacteriaceae bacterium]|nr:GNAT family N-acetyltransferase [Symbiobacteriaceae bacterium]
MPVTIRPVRPDDYAALAAAANAAFPGVPHAAEDLRDDDESTKPPQKCFRWVADVDGRVVGTASFYQSQARYHPRKFWMDEWVHPEFQRQGIGSALFAQIISAIAPDQPISLRGATREDIPHGVAFAERRGFVEGKRTWVSWLDLGAWDPARLARPEPAGIEICTLAELQGAPGWEQHLLDLYNAIQTDVPDIDPAATVEMESFRSSQLDSPRLMPDLYFIARDGERWVGMTSLWKAADPVQGNTGVTGVLREYRGRSIAWTLKLRSLKAAQARGYKKVETMNASTNRPMLAINEAFGFVKDPAWIHLIREF